MNPHIRADGVQRNLAKIARYFNFFKFLFRYVNQGGAKNIIVFFRTFQYNFNVEHFSLFVTPNGICMSRVQISVVKLEIFTFTPPYDNGFRIAADVAILKVSSRNVLIHFFRSILNGCVGTVGIIFCTGGPVGHQLAELRRHREAERQRLGLVGAEVALRILLAAVVVEVHRQDGGVGPVAPAQHRPGGSLVVGDGGGLDRLLRENRDGSHSLAGGVEEAIQEGVVVLILRRNLGVGIALNAVDDQIAVLPRIAVLPAAAVFDGAAGEKHAQAQSGQNRADLLHRITPDSNGASAHSWCRRSTPRPPRRRWR